MVFKYILLKSTVSGSGLKNKLNFVAISQFSQCVLVVKNVINGVVGHQFEHGIHVRVGLGPPQFTHGLHLAEVNRVPIWT